MELIKKFFIAAIFICFTIATEVPARADNSKLYYAPEISYVLPVDGDVDDTIFLGGRIGYPMTPEWSFELESGWMQYGWDVSDAYQNVDVTTIPILGNLRYGRRCYKDEPGWYVFGGIGVGINDMESNGADANTDDSFIWQAGVGAEMTLMKIMDGFIDVRYMYNNINISAPDAVTSVKDDLNATAILFTGGVRF